MKASYVFYLENYARMRKWKGSGRLESLLFFFSHFLNNNSI